MYIPTWLIIVVAVIAYLIYKSSSKNKVLGYPENIEFIEEKTAYLKGRIFELAHFDSPHFIDCQDAYDMMEINYMRLKQRYSTNPDKILEIAKDWYGYVVALGDLKHARVMLDVDMEDGAFDRLEESLKEPSVIKDEVEKKYKSLLGDDFQAIPPDYFKRMETMGEPDKKTKDSYGIGDVWKYYYQNSSNLFKLVEQRAKKEKEEKIAKK